MNWKYPQKHAGLVQGDPIEAAAAASLLLENRQKQPLAMMAAKSSIGHSEPAAGVMNMLHACAAQQSIATLPILHLHSLNPHITSAFDQSAAKGKLHLPRQATAMVAAPGGTQIVSGVSAFAFQGTNAHVLLQGAAPRGAGQFRPTQSSLIWQQSRHWLAPQPHTLLTAFVKHAGSTLLMQCQLNQPKLAGFLDHRVMDKALFPAAGFLELASASARASLQSGGPQSSQHVVIGSITIPMPLELATMSGEHEAEKFEFAFWQQTTSAAAPLQPIASEWHLVTSLHSMTSLVALTRPSLNVLLSIILHVSNCIISCNTTALCKPLI